MSEYKSPDHSSPMSVWDTYVTKDDGTIMHFDIIAPIEVKDVNIIYEYGRQYLQTKGQGNQELNANQCTFCHIESLKPSWEDDIKRQGYYIVEMEGCH